MANYSQIATILNNEFIPNLNGVEVTIAEDLSNIVELGTAIADMDAETLKSPFGNFALGVARNLYRGKKYSADNYGIYRDAQEYAGALQIVMLDSDDVEMSDDPSTSLISGENYFDGTYYGIDADSRLYSDDKAFQVKHSIPQTMFKTMFMSAENVASYVALIEQTIRNKVEKVNHAMSKALLCKAIESVYSETNAPRVYHLFTEYNTEFGYTSTDDGYVTKANYKKNIFFLTWCSAQITRLKDGMKELNKKCNNGVVETFTSEDDLRMVLLSEFSTACTYFMENDTFHNDIVKLPNHYSTPYWQNSSNKLIDTMGVTGEVYEKNGTKRTNVVGLLYNYNMAGVTTRLDKITSQYIANGDYVTYFHHFMRRMFLDMRNDAIVLALD